MAGSLFLQPWQIYGAITEDGELNPMDFVLGGRQSLDSRSAFAFDVHAQAQASRHLVQSSAHSRLYDEVHDEAEVEADVEFGEVEPMPKRPKMSSRMRAAPAQSTKLKALLLAWLMVLSIDPSSSEAGKLIADSKSEADKLEVVHAYVSGKAVNTLAARLSSIMRFVKFIEGHQEMWPPTVKSIRVFVMDKLVDGAPTALQRFLEALVFLVYTFRFGRATLEAGQSLYYQGLANLNLKKLGLRKQAQPLPFHAIATMEAILADTSYSDMIRLVAGGMLFLVYFRARVNDMALVLGFHVFDTFVECETESAKTSSKDRLHTTFVGPRVTISGIDIWQIYIDLRNYLGVPLVGGALFPAMDNEGNFINVQAVLSDIIALIRSVCALCGVENSESVGTHSGKVSLLFAAVVFGIGKDARGRLGYHKLPGDRSINSYARDLLIEPVQQLTRLVLAARSGTFDPTACRVVHTDSQDELPETQEADVPDDDELEGWMDEGELLVPAEEEQVDANMHLVELWSMKCKGDNRLYRHTGTGKTHRGNPDAADKTACHFFLTASYDRLATLTDEDCDEPLKLCKNCFGKDERLGRQLVRKLSAPLLDNLREEDKYLNL